MVICFFVGCMCEPCKRKRSPAKVPQFREPIGNSMILCRALRELFPVWSAANGQALRSWIISMPASIRGRLHLLPEEHLRQYCVTPLFVLCCVRADADSKAVHASCTTGHTVCVHRHRGCVRCDYNTSCMHFNVTIHFVVMKCIFSGIFEARKFSRLPWKFLNHAMHLFSVHIS